MLVTYPALFYYDDSDGTNAPYFVHFTDFSNISGTQGKDISDALEMASEWLGMNAADCIDIKRYLTKRFLLCSPILC